jgi:hypothetical protein
MCGRTGYIGSDLNITTTTLCCNQVGGTTPSANGSCVVDQALNTNVRKQFSYVVIDGLWSVTNT